MIVFIIGFLSNVFGICCDIDQDQYEYLLKKGMACGLIDDDETDAKSRIINGKESTKIYPWMAVES